MKFKLKQPNLKFIMTEQFVAKKYKLDWNAGMSWSRKKELPYNSDRWWAACSKPRSLGIKYIIYSVNIHVGHHATPINIGCSYHNDSANFTKCFLGLIFELLKFREDSMQHERQMSLLKKRINCDLCWKLRLMPMGGGGDWDNHRAYLNINFPSNRRTLVIQLNIKPWSLFARKYSRVFHCNHSHSALWCGLLGSLSFLTISEIQWGIKIYLVKYHIHNCYNTLLFWSLC